MHGTYIKTIEAKLSCFQKSTFYVWIKISTVYHIVWQSWRINDKILNSLKKILSLLLLCRWIFYLCRWPMILFCKLFTAFYTVQCMYLCIYDLFHIVLSLGKTYGSMECTYVCIYVRIYMSVNWEVASIY